MANERWRRTELYLFFMYQIQYGWFIRKRMLYKLINLLEVALLQHFRTDGTTRKRLSISSVTVQILLQTR